MEIMVEWGEIHHILSNNITPSGFLMIFLLFCCYKLITPSGFLLMVVLF